MLSSVLKSRLLCNYQSSSSNAGSTTEQMLMTIQQSHFTGHAMVATFSPAEGPMMMRPLPASGPARCEPNPHTLILVMPLIPGPYLFYKKDANRGDQTSQMK